MESQQILANHVPVQAKSSKFSATQCCAWPEKQFAEAKTKGLRISLLHPAVYYNCRDLIAAAMES